MSEIFVKKVRDNGWKLIIDPIESNEKIPINFKEEEYKLEEYKRDKNFLVNFFKDKKDDLPHFGGDIENLFTLCKFTHSRRVFGLHPRNRKKLTISDVVIGFNEFVKYRKTIKESDAWKNMYV